ncbi:MAG: hypothetical protein IJJ14_07365 [Coriobacteriales bacterium]|nr:hypothetical protein [Coriobacteriales bacterium]
MKRVLVKSVFDAFDYVMDHYYPAGQREFAQRDDTYVVISIQDTHTQGFGFEFTRSACCKGVLTLLFDDIVRPVEGAVLFTPEQAAQIIDFVWDKRDNVDTLLVHCYGGESRSRAVGAFITRMLGGDDSVYFETGHPTEPVYDTLEMVWIQRLIARE